MNKLLDTLAYLLYSLIVFSVFILTMYLSICALVGVALGVKRLFVFAFGG